MNQERNQQNCTYCNAPISQPHQQELHEQTPCVLRQEIAKQATIIEALLGLLESANSKRLELQSEVNNFLTFGQGGANFNESQLIAEIAKLEMQLAQAKTKGNCNFCNGTGSYSIPEKSSYPAMYGEEEIDLLGSPGDGEYKHELLSQPNATLRVEKVVKASEEDN